MNRTLLVPRGQQRTRIVTLNRHSLVLALSGVIAALALGACGIASAGLTAASAGAGVSFQHVAGAPFGVVAVRDGRYAFLDLLTGARSSVHLL